MLFLPSEAFFALLQTEPEGVGSKSINISPLTGRKRDDADLMALRVMICDVNQSARDGSDLNNLESYYL